MGIIFGYTMFDFRTLASQARYRGFESHHPLLGYSVVKVLGTLTIESLVTAAAMLEHGGGVVLLLLETLVDVLHNSALRENVQGVDLVRQLPAPFDLLT